MRNHNLQKQKQVNPVQLTDPACIFLTKHEAQAFISEQRQNSAIEVEDILESLMKQFIMSMSKEEKQKMMQQFMDSLSAEEKTDMMKTMMPIMMNSMKPEMMADMMSEMMQSFKPQDFERMMNDMPSEMRTKCKTMMTECLKAIKQLEKP